MMATVFQIVRCSRCKLRMKGECIAHVGLGSSVTPACTRLPRPHLPIDAATKDDPDGGLGHEYKWLVKPPTTFSYTTGPVAIQRR